MAKNKILILNPNDLTAMRFATTLKNIGTASEIVDFTKAIFEDEPPLADLDGGNLYVLGTLELGDFKIAPKFDAKTLAEIVLELGLTKCGELWLVVCNSATKNPFKEDKVFLDDFNLELRRHSLLNKMEGGTCAKVGSLVGYRGYVGFYDYDTVKLDGGKQIAEYLLSIDNKNYGAQYIHTEPTPMSKENKFLTPKEGVVVVQGFDHLSWEIAKQVTL